MTQKQSCTRKQVDWIIRARLSTVVKLFENNFESWDMSELLAWRVIWLSRVFCDCDGHLHWWMSGVDQVWVMWEIVDGDNVSHWIDQGGIVNNELSHLVNFVQVLNGWLTVIPRLNETIKGTVNRVSQVCFSLMMTPDCPKIQQLSSVDFSTLVSRHFSWNMFELWRQRW